MKKIAVVTDSTACIPQELKNNLPIYVLPAHVIWGEKTYKDGVDIQPTEFFLRLKTTTETPRTSQVTTQEFVHCYRNLLEQGFEILSIHVSGRVSGMIDSAKQAAQEIASGKIVIVDSMTSSAAMAFQVVEAARAVIKGAALKECVAIAEKIRAHTHIYFIPGTLEFLHRGGRIGGAAAFLGSLLKIHPILETRNGIIDAVERVRTMSRAMQRVVELIDQKVGDCKHIRLAGLYADIPQLAQQLLEIASVRLGKHRIKETFISTISPTLGVHIGPGAVGMAFLYSND